jgi:hypothetical protein
MCPLVDCIAINHPFNEKEFIINEQEMPRRVRSDSDSRTELLSNAVTCRAGLGHVTFLSLHEGGSGALCAC